MAKKVNLNWAQDGVIDLESKPLELYSNTTGIFTQVASYKIPRGRVAMLSRNEKVNMYIPTRETVTHTGGGAETFDITHGILEGNGLNKEDIIRAFVKSNGVEIAQSDITPDYNNNQVDITHNTNEDLYVYYLPANGQARIVAVKPTGSGGNYKRLFNSSLRKIHSVNQLITNSDVNLERSWIMKEKHILKVEVKADFTVHWLSENSDIGENLIGGLWIPFRYNRIENFTDEEIAHINARYSF